MKKYLVYLNVFSSFAVVMLHTNFIFWTFSTESYWISANVIESLFYFAVPIFVMITGANLIGYSEKYSTVQYIKKRVDRTVVPFFVWMGIAHTLVLYKRTRTFPLLNSDNIHKQLKWIILCCFIAILYFSVKKVMKYPIINIVLKLLLLLITFITFIKVVDSHSGTTFDIINNIVHTKYWDIYWYFIVLFAVYIAIPIFEVISKDSRQKVFGTIIGVTFVFGFLVKFIIQFMPNGFYNANLILPFQTYIWYALVGYYIDNYTIKKEYRYIIYCLGVIGLCLQLFGTSLLSLQSGVISSVFKGYLNVPTILYSVAIFVGFKYLPQNVFNGTFWNINLLLSKITFGIYLIHSLLIEILKFYTPLDFKRLSVRLFVGIFIFVVSAIIVYVYQKCMMSIKTKIKKRVT